VPGYCAEGVELVAAWSVDRLGRSLQDLVAFLGEIKAAGVDLYLHKQGLDTSSPAGKALFQMLGVFSEFERSIIVERTLAGLARARAQGIRVGAKVEDAIRAALGEGQGIIKIAKAIGCGVGTVQRIKAATISEL
jgi:DNA invertase Pin-like site-specific DNA recombinase